MNHCPSQDWDRHCAGMDAPQPVGKERLVRSKQPQVCESCYGKIPAGHPHLMMTQLSSDDGLFTKPLRLHIQGECLPQTYDEWDVVK
jgi:hypothetical protein